MTMDMLIALVLILVALSLPVADFALSLAGRRVSPIVKPQEPTT